MFGVSRMTVSLWRRQLGVVTASPAKAKRAIEPRPQYSEEFRRQVASTPGSDTAVARQFGVSPWTVRRWRNDAACSTRELPDLQASMLTPIKHPPARQLTVYEWRDEMRAARRAA